MTHKNQRHKSKQKPGDRFNTILNVRGCETRDLRRVRRGRIVRMAFKGLVLLSGCFMFCLLVKSGYERIFIDSGHFLLRQIDIQTNGRTDRAKVLAVAGVREGMNLLKVDLAKVGAALETLPQVETAEVRRRLPDAIEIRLDERVPVAWVSCPAAGWRPKSATMGLLVDTQGRLFRCDILAADLVGLPVVELNDGKDVLQPGSHLTARQSLVCLKTLVATAQPDPADLPRLVSASVRNGYTIAVRTEDGVEAWLGLDDPIGDYRKFAAILRQLSGNRQRVAFANLLPRRNIAVRFEQAEPAPAPARPATAPVRRARPAAPAATGGETPASAADLANDVRAILNRR